jgi:hypothetical protein
MNELCNRCMKEQEESTMIVYDWAPVEERIYSLTKTVGNDSYVYKVDVFVLDLLISLLTDLESDRRTFYDVYDVSFTLRNGNKIAFARELYKNPPTL